MSSGVRRYSIVEIQAALIAAQAGELTYTREQIANALEQFAKSQELRRNPETPQNETAVLLKAARRIREGTLYPFGDR